jgi:Transposase, Mutator family
VPGWEDLAVTIADDPVWKVLLRRGFVLEYVTLAWNVAGIVVLAIAAILARSVALAGFGLDSLIEIGASTVGLTGLPDAIGVTWSQAVVQLCMQHLIRASLRYASKRDWEPLTKDLKLIYTAADEEAAAAALEAFAAQWESRYPAIVKLWRAHWQECVPFLAFPPEVRRVVYTTNLIEGMNARLHKVTRRATRQEGLHPGRASSRPSSRPGPGRMVRSRSADDLSAARMRW